MNLETGIIIALIALAIFALGWFLGIKEGRAEIIYEFKTQLKLGETMLMIDRKNICFHLDRIIHTKRNGYAQTKYCFRLTNGRAVAISKQVTSENLIIALLEVLGELEEKISDGHVEFDDRQKEYNLTH